MSEVHEDMHDSSNEEVGSSVQTEDEGMEYLEGDEDEEEVEEEYGQPEEHDEDLEEEVDGDDENARNNEEQNVRQIEEQNAPNVQLDCIEDIDMVSLTPAQFKGLEFTSADCAYMFYNEYGRIHGFGIRRSKRWLNQKKEVAWVKFVCNKAGFREEKYFNLPNRKKRPRALSRCGCTAELHLRFDSSTRVWYMANLCDDHNHPLLGDKCIGRSRSHRKMSDADVAQFNCMRKSGISTPLIYGSFGVQSGTITNIGFGLKQCYTQIEKQRKWLEDDFKEALKYLRELENEDDGFFWKHAMGEDGSFMHLFWCDGSCRLDYQLFGDVLAFDATYGRNKYKFPLVIFSGVNHHKQTCVFATCIVSNETENTYVWVLEQFLEAMKGKCPKTVITDGDVAMRKAISLVFPEAHHRLCAWHLLRNATSNVHMHYFTKKFKKCMLYDYEVSEFEQRWKRLVEICGLQDNVWVCDLYDRKMMWASAHIRGKFFAGFRTTSRCEGLHSVIGKYVKKGYNFIEFIQQFERCLENLRNNEIEADYKSQFTEPVLETEFTALEKFGAQVYTRAIFSVFRTVMKKSAHIYMLEYKETPSAKIYVMGRYCLPHMKWHVSFYPAEDVLKCSCRHMESVGIPCTHIMRVMILLDMKQLPRCLLLDRWMKGVKEGVIENMGEDRGRRNSLTNRYKYGSLVYVCRDMCRLACFSEEDYMQVKGLVESERKRLREKHGEVGSGSTVYGTIDVHMNVSSGGPSSSQRRSKTKPQCCSICRKEGHNRSTCPFGIQLMQHLQLGEGSSSHMNSHFHHQSSETYEDLDADSDS